MRILVIGGTRFVGHGMAEAALAAGHDVTLLHRNPTDELPVATHLLTDRDGDLSVLAEARVGRHDRRLRLRPVAGTTAARGPRATAAATTSSSPRVSVYREPSGPDADEDSPLFDEPTDGSEEVTNETYGPLKVACERVAREAYGDDGLAVIRPTYVVGPRDATARYPWWPLRAARGGPMIAPGPLGGADAVHRRARPGRVDGAARRGPGGRGRSPRPDRATTFGDLLDETVGATRQRRARLVPVDGDWLVEQGVDGMQLPLWTEGGAEWSLAMATVARRGRRADPPAASPTSSATPSPGRRPTPTRRPTTSWGLLARARARALAAWASQA